MAFLRLPLGFLKHRLARFQSRATLEANQLKRFRRLLRHVVPKSRYYRSIVEDRGIDVDSCRPEDFPEMSKDDIVEHFNDILTVNDVDKRAVLDFLDSSKDPRELLRDRYFCLHTSGSSGTIGYCLFDQRDWYSGMAPALLHQPTPRGRRNRVAFIGAVQGHFAGVSITAVGDRFPLSLAYRIHLLDIHDEITNNIEILNRFRPDLIVGYPAALIQLAEEQVAGRLNIRPRLIHSSGAMLFPYDRKLVSNTFGAPVVNFYACSEHLFVGASDGSGPGMRLFEDFLYIEPQSDHTLITNLYNRTLPLIRYRMDDTLELVDAAGRGPHRFVSETIGRHSDSTVFINQDGEEDYISSIVMTTVFVKNLRRFQVHVHDKQHFTLWAVLDSGTNSVQQEKALADIKVFWDKLLQQKHMENVRYEVKLADHLAPDPKTGKHQLVITDPRPAG